MLRSETPSNNSTQFSLELPNCNLYNPAPPILNVKSISFYFTASSNMSYSFPRRGGFGRFGTKRKLIQSDVAMCLYCFHRMSNHSQCNLGDSET